MWISKPLHTINTWAFIAVQQIDAARSIWTRVAFTLVDNVLTVSTMVTNWTLTVVLVHQVLTYATILTRLTLTLIYLIFTALSLITCKRSSIIVYKRWSINNVVVVIITNTISNITYIVMVILITNTEIIVIISVIVVT